MRRKPTQNRKKEAIRKAEVSASDGFWADYHDEMVRF